MELLSLWAPNTNQVLFPLVFIFFWFYYQICPQANFNEILVRNARRPFIINRIRISSIRFASKVVQQKVKYVKQRLDLLRLRNREQAAYFTQFILLYFTFTTTTVQIFRTSYCPHSAMQRFRFDQAVGPVVVEFVGTIRI